MIPLLATVLISCNTVNGIIQSIPKRNFNDQEYSDLVATIKDATNPRACDFMPHNKEVNPSLK